MLVKSHDAIQRHKATIRYNFLWHLNIFEWSICHVRHLFKGVQRLKRCCIKDVHKSFILLYRMQQLGSRNDAGLAAVTVMSTYRRYPGQNHCHVYIPVVSRTTSLWCLHTDGIQDKVTVMFTYLVSRTTSLWCLHTDGIQDKVTVMFTYLVSRTTSLWCLHTDGIQDKVTVMFTYLWYPGQHHCDAYIPMVSRTRSLWCLHTCGIQDNIIVMPTYRWYPGQGHCDVYIPVVCIHDKVTLMSTYRWYLEQGHCGVLHNDGIQDNIIMMSTYRW